VRASSEGDEDIEMEVPQFGRGKVAIRTNSGQYLTRFDPTIFRLSQNGNQPRSCVQVPGSRGAVTGPE